MSLPTTTTTGPACAIPTCPEKVCPECKPGYTCSLSVIDSTCKCPIASCVKIPFDTGVDNGSDTNTESASSGSVIGPVLGAIAGLGVVALIAFFVIRRGQRRRRKEAMMMLGQDDSLDSFSKRWHSSNGDLSGKDVIRIAYIPSMIGDSPVVTPEATVQRGGVLKQNFSPLQDEDRNKHDSMASLDEAVVMAVTTKATPQVMKLNTIKTTQADLIQRSNTLHSTNSIKRSQSQRHQENKKASRKNPSPLGNTTHHSDSDTEVEEDSDIDGASNGPNGKAKRRSATGTASGNNQETNPFMTKAELVAANHTQNNGNTPSSRLSNPFLSAAESSAITSNANSSSVSLVSTTSSIPMTGTTAVFASIPITLAEHRRDSDPLLDLATGVNLRPWATSSAGSTAMRDSTFSTMSDSRSSTRGDGEEIMIFWDGHRDSKANM